MTSHVVTLEFAKATQVRISGPADRPTEAVGALVELFADCPNVVSARLGLMEVLPEDGDSYFTYVVGIECEGSARSVEQRAAAVLQEVPPGRLPIAFVPPTARFFTRDAVVFYSRKAKPRSWIKRVLGRR
jgi:hypothetical protein